MSYSENENIMLGKVNEIGMTVDTTPSEESHVQALVNFFEQKDMDCEVDKYPFKVRDGMGGSYGYELKYSCIENL